MYNHSKCKRNIRLHGCSDASIIWTQCLKIPKKSHSTLRAKHNVTRHGTLNRTKIGENAVLLKLKNSNATIWVIFKHCAPYCYLIPAHFLCRFTPTESDFSYSAFTSMSIWGASRFCTMRWPLFGKKRRKSNDFRWLTKRKSFNLMMFVPFAWEAWKTLVKLIVNIYFMIIAWV